MSLPKFDLLEVQSSQLRRIFEQHYRQGTVALELSCFQISADYAESVDIFLQNSVNIDNINENMLFFILKIPCYNMPVKRKLHLFRMRQIQFAQ